MKEEIMQSNQMIINFVNSAGKYADYWHLCSNDDCRNYMENRINFSLSSATNCLKDGDKNG